LWLCIAGAVHGSVGGISGFGLVALAALVLGVQAFPSFLGMYSLYHWRHHGSKPFPWRRLLHSTFYSRGDVLGFYFLESNGELQSIKAHRIIGEGRRHDFIEDSKVDSTLDKTSWIFTMVAAILTLIGWVFGVMLAAGARCVHSGGEELCGVGGTVEGWRCWCSEALDRLSSLLYGLD
jgi:hypothetical protein